jgi:hypothetical protein
MSFGTAACMYIRESAARRWRTQDSCTHEVVELPDVVGSVRSHWRGMDDKTSAILSRMYACTQLN